jgi:putative ABC transport system permease protein
MFSTKWMVLCLLVGFMTAAGVMCAVPIYTDASLQRMLIKDMEEYQSKTDAFPGEYNVWLELRTGAPADAVRDIAGILPDFAEERVKRVGIPASSRKTVIRDSMLYIVKGSVSEGSSHSTSRVRVSAMTGFAGRVNITSGRMYSETGEDGVIEVAVSEQALKVLGISLGGEYEISPSEASRERFKVRVVGVFEPLDEKDVYWSEKMDAYMTSLIVDYDYYLNELLPSGTVLASEIYARYGLDYRKLDMNKIGAVTAAIRDDFSVYPEIGFKFQMGAYDILLEYVDRAASLTRVLWALQIPVMVMLGFYLFMVSRLNVEGERNEISLLRSRGASGGQIFSLYAMEAGVLGIISFVCAPFAGLALCRFLGVSDGFLEFVNRRGLSAKITSAALIYAFAAVAVFFVTAVLPVIPASRLSIVQYKRNRVKSAKTPLWEKFMADFILIGAGLAFLYFYTSGVEKAIEENAFSPTGEIDPLLFIFSSCLIMGLGLFFLRVYPYALSLIYLLGRRFWNPSQYIAITAVRRSDGGERFLMLFLVITFSLGIFSANTARTINNNKSDMIYYSNGADVTLKEYWLSSDGGGDAAFYYKETDFEKYENLAGVETAAKVLRNESVRVAPVSGSSGGTRTVTLMAVEPDKFARTAWFRDDLLPVHWWNYCNALTEYKSGIIISRSLGESAGLGLGDGVTVRWGRSNVINATVIAITDWWPGINPYETDRDGAAAERSFAVMNYNFVRAQTELEPYEIWLKMEKGAGSEALYDDIKANNLPIQTLTDSSQQLIAAKTDPKLQGMNGALTLGFTVIMAMTVIGFLIYWILSIKGRTLLFGVMRAMGLSFREIIGVLGYEQLLVSGASIAAAFIIGGVTSDLFVPLFQNMYAVSEQIPPFYVAAARRDYIRMYILIAVMLGAGFAALGGIIRNISVNKALKLGED